MSTSFRQTRIDMEMDKLSDTEDDLCNAIMEIGEEETLSRVDVTVLRVLKDELVWTQEKMKSLLAPIDDSDEKFEAKRDDVANLN